MRKMFLCNLMVIGVMNFCFGQSVKNTKRLTVQTINKDGSSEQFQLNGAEVLSFDIPAFIKENAHLDRVLINGYIKEDLSSTILKYDSDKQEDIYTDYICENTETKFTPFLGVEAIEKIDLNGVNLKKIVPTTTAAIAGISTNESILEYNDEVLNSPCDLISAIKTSSIGERVRLKLENGGSPYYKNVIMGSRGTKTVTYKHCTEEAFELAGLNNKDVITEEVSMNIYPNPTRDISYISYTSASDEDVIFSVKDMLGSLVYREVISDFSDHIDIDYDLSAESDGTYIITIQQGQVVQNQKVQLTK